MFDAEPLRAASGFLLTVDPKVQGQGIGRNLLEKYLEGPQDLSLVDRANPAFVSLFKKIGGMVAPYDSLNWRVVLKPIQFGCMVAGRRSRLISAATSLIRPIVERVDMRLSPLRKHGTEGVTLEVLAFSIEEFLRCLSFDIKSNQITLPLDPGAGRWLGHIIQNANSAGKLFIARDISKLENVGAWCVWGEKDNSAEILYLSADQVALSAFLEAFFCTISERGICAASGRVDIGQLPHLSRFVPFIKAGPSQAVFKTSIVLLRDALINGETSIPRLAGEWWIEFPPYM